MSEFDAEKLFNDLEKDMKNNQQIIIKNAIYATIKNAETQGFKTREEINALIQSAIILKPELATLIPLINVYVNQYFSEKDI